jgi:hypothetical protein
MLKFVLKSRNNSWEYRKEGAKIMYTDASFTWVHSLINTLLCTQHTNDLDYSASDCAKKNFGMLGFGSTRLHSSYFPTAVTTYDRNNGLWQKIFRVTHDAKLHHVVSEVSLESVAFTLVCVKEETNQITIYLWSKPEDGGWFCSRPVLPFVIIILMNKWCKSP